MEVREKGFENLVQKSEEGKEKIDLKSKMIRGHRAKMPLIEDYCGQRVREEMLKDWIRLFSAEKRV